VEAASLCQHPFFSGRLIDKIGAMKKLWGGRFKADTDAEFAKFNDSFEFDRRLCRVDILGSIAYCHALRRAGVISAKEARTIQAGLETILARVEADPGHLSHHHAEDVHSFVEAELHQLIGEAALKLHTGRSRNDQVSTDLRLYLRDQCETALSLLGDVQSALLDLAEANVDIAMPGYTHLQKAQPILLAHYLLAYFEMFERDKARFRHARKQVNQLPLGSGAIAGTSLAIDRRQLARDLGFEGVTKNSVDAVSDRDFVIEFAFATAVTLVHLSRLAEDFILYSTAEFGFLVLSDSVATGSSLMPQKKNPDALELIRGKAGRVFGHLMALLSVMKGLPLSYNKDMQEDKEAIFDTVDTLNSCLRVTTIVLRNVGFRKDRLTQAAAADYANATELADYLVRKRLPFRKAHELVGRIVLYASEANKGLGELGLEEYRRFSKLFEDDLYEAISLSSAIAKKRQPGGTSPQQVRRALRAARRTLSPPRRINE
jgi:argininosuccinate lyase